MRIACLGWGSLLWKSAPLALASAWMDDGPTLPIEFSREADGGELATALSPASPDVQVFWARLESTDLAAAREQLRIREQIPVSRVDGVGSDPSATGGGPFDARIRQWSSSRDLDAVIWTALPPRSLGIEGRMPGVVEACAYLAGLPHDVRRHAEAYVRRVPPSLKTVYRAAFEARFGWTPRDDDA